MNKNNFILFLKYHGSKERSAAATIKTQSAVPGRAVPSHNREFPRSRAVVRGERVGATALSFSVSFGRVLTITN